MKKGSKNIGNLNNRHAKTKFMQTLTTEQVHKLKSLAAAHDVSIQEYIRIFIVGPYLRSVRTPRKVVHASRSLSALRGWEKRRAKMKMKPAPDDITRPIGTFNPNLPPVPRPLSQMEH